MQNTASIVAEGGASHGTCYFHLPRRTRPLGRRVLLRPVHRGGDSGNLRVDAAEIAVKIMRRLPFDTSRGLATRVLMLFKPSYHPIISFHLLLR